MEVIHQHDSNLKRLMLLMDEAYQNCSHQIIPLVTERLAEIIYQVMSARYRIFHTMDHLFTASQGMQGITVFAALFHDLIYYQVDKRIHPLLSDYFSEFHIHEKTNVCILPNLDQDRSLMIVGRVFGVNEGQSLNPMNGLNEFLSALAAARLLNQSLTEWQIVQVAACIEATIPFRNQTQANNSFQRLHQRLQKMNQELKLQATEAEINATMKISVALANQDVCSFYSKDFGEFISGTWSLILENNPIFKNPLYTVHEYSKALKKVHSFFSTLDFESVVHEWQGSPTAMECMEMKRQVSLNLKNALEYLDLKLLEITILEVIDLSTGGDAPYFLLIGDSGQLNKAPIERYFPESRNSSVNPHRNELVYRILKDGRKAKAPFDFNHSPIAAYLYENLNGKELRDAINFAQNFHLRKMDAQQYMKTFRPEIINPILKGVSEISWSRSMPLL